LARGIEGKPEGRGVTLMQARALELAEFLPAREAAPFLHLTKRAFDMRLYRARRRNPDLPRRRGRPGGTGRLVSASQLGSIDRPFNLDSIY
jgi:hypothetical protein